MKTTSKAFQTGQALPLGLVLLVAVAAIVFYMFNSGQLVQEKIRLTNTADAVAYSAGVFEARVLNYDAYTNRAIIANEIAIGQAVGLASWAKYAAVSADNIAPWAYLIPYVGSLIADALEEFADLVNGEGSYYPGLTFALAASVTLHDGALQALAMSQYAVHGPANAIALATRKQVMDDVARKNDPDAHVDLLPLADNFMGFTQRYASQDERKRMGQLVHDDRDPFLVKRNWQFPALPRWALCWLGAPDIKKRGSTELIDLTEGWKSMDTVSIHQHWISWKNLKPRCRSREIPIGYGTAFSDDGLDDSAYSYAGSRNTNPQASDKAEDEVAKWFEPVTFDGGAIPAFFDLSESTLKNTPKDPRATLTIRVTKDSSKQSYSGGASVVKPAGQLDLYSGNHAKSQSAAISSVEVFFERPDGNNPLFNKEEYGNLFNPYWQVRLVPVSGTSRVMAQGLQGRITP